MGMIESAYEVRNVADYYVAGENLLFAWFPYHRYLSGSLLTFSTDPRKLAINLVERYNEGVVSERNPFSIAAIHLRQLVDSDIAVKLNNLGTKLKDLGSTLAGNVYANTLKFDSNANYTIDADETYVDLGDFLLQLEALDPTSIPTAAGSIQQDAAAISALLLNGDKPIVVRQRQVSGVYQQDGIRATYEFTRATGLSIYMPLGAPDKRNEIVEDPANPTRPKIKTVNQLDYYTNTTLPVCADATGCNHLSFTISGAAKGWADWLSGSSALTGQSLSHKAPNPLPANTQLYRIFLPEIGR
jgi:hypothetical protein